MHQVQEEIGLPKIKSDKKSDFHTIFTLSPLPPGYGMTLGNSLRRILLSSLPGSCVTSIKIPSVTHQYSTVKGCKESVLDIILNLKQLHIKKATKEPSTIKLDVSKPGVIKAKDIQTTSDIEILNPDLYITTLDGKSNKLKIEMKVEKGVGYVPLSQRKEEKEDPTAILIDAIYSPVIKIKYEVTNTRVGEMTNLDKLDLEIMTDGTILPDDALKFSANILSSYYGLFNKEGIIVEGDFMSNFDKIIENEKAQQKTKPVQEAYTPIEILGFSPRTLNALINGGIGSIEQLSKCTESKLTNLRGFGKKALTEVKDALSKRSLNLSEE